MERWWLRLAFVTKMVWTGWRVKGQAATSAQRGMNGAYAAQTSRAETLLLV